MDAGYTGSGAPHDKSVTRQSSLPSTRNVIVSKVEAASLAHAAYFGTRKLIAAAGRV
jgi:hypothetical protein